MSEIRVYQCECCGSLVKKIHPFSFKLEKFIMNGEGSKPAINPIEVKTQVCSQACALKKFEKATRGFWQGERPRKKEIIQLEEDTK